MDPREVQMLLEFVKLVRGYAGVTPPKDVELLPTVPTDEDPRASVFQILSQIREELVAIREDLNCLRRESPHYSGSDILC